MTNSLFNSFIPLNQAILSALVVAVSSLFYPSILWSKALLYFSCYIMTMLTYVTFGKTIAFGYGNGDINRILIEGAFILPALLIGRVIEFKNSYKLNRAIFVATLFSIASCLIIISPIMTQTDLLREAALAIGNGNVNGMRYKMMGIPDYNSMHIYPLFFSILVVSLKYHKSIVGSYFIYLIIIMLLIIFTLSATITTMILYLFLSIFLVVFMRNPGLYRYMIFSVLMFIFILIYQLDVHIVILNYLVDLFADTAVESKIKDLQTYLLYGTESKNLTGRGSLHMISIDSLLSNPLIGGDVVGGHSNLLDRLASLGILGFTPHIILIYTQYYAFRKKMTKEFRFYYNIAWLGALIVLIFKGLFGAVGWLFIFAIIPTTLLYVQSSLKHRNNESVY
jgi:hypothetical protein